ncbi:antibiotic biosynthesis monooxygenase [Streptomyces sp. NPDC090127]|uniref:antibiotic biosynthesis monooxygenase n=1 Tax=Streptomyces sp. NPDC090127 TaxID=3365953 RepID=UPI00380344A4
MNAVAHPDARPDLYRPGVGLVLVSTWQVGTPERQRATVDAIAGAWKSRDWPDAGLLSYSVYLGTDGDTLLHYSQWTGEEAYQGFLRTLRDDRNAEIDAAVPGIVRAGIHRYAPPYRSAVLSEESAAAVPASVAFAEVEFDGPDSARQRAWVDDVCAALDESAGTRPAHGGIAAHFHLSTDGARVLDYVEWESLRAQEEWQGADASADAWARVRRFPGLSGSLARRCTPALSLHAGV